MNTIRDMKFEWTQGFGNVVRPILLLGEIDPDTIEFEERDNNYVGKIGSIVESFYDMKDARGMQGRPMFVKMASGGMKALSGVYPVPPINFPELHTIEALVTSNTDDFAKEENLAVAYTLLDDIIEFIDTHPLLPVALARVKRLQDNTMWIDFVHRDVDSGEVAAKDYGESKVVILETLTNKQLAIA